MENIIYNELLCREFNVDVGVVEYCYKDEQKRASAHSWRSTLWQNTRGAAGIISNLP